MLTYKNRVKSTNFIAKRRQFTPFFCNYFTLDGIIWDYMGLYAYLSGAIYRISHEKNVFLFLYTACLYPYGGMYRQ